MQRCDWIAGKPDFYVNYHDEVWGYPCHDDQELFKWLILETFSTGLSWQIVLTKKEAFEEAFDQFDPQIVSRYGDDKVLDLLSNAGIIRHRKKIEATIQNAQAFIAIQKEFASFDAYIWSFTREESIHQKDGIRKTKSDLSDKVTEDLKRRNFRWVGSVTIYSYLQAIGILNDHDQECFCYEKLKEQKKS